MADADEPRADEPRADEPRGGFATVAAAALGGLGLLWWLTPNRRPVIVDDAASRRETVAMLDANPGVAGATALHDYLLGDGFLTYTWDPPKVGNASPLLLGEGSGYTRWDHALEALHHFNLPGGGRGLRAAVTRAIRGTPQGDDPGSRAQVVQWLETLAAAGDPGFVDLVADLSAGGWASGQYVPPTAPPPVWKTLAVGRESTTIIDYPRWLIDLDTRKLLDRVEPVAHHGDPTARDRELVWLTVERAVATKVPGFDVFAAQLGAAGWNAHPPDKKIPAPGTVVIPVLGGDTNVDVAVAFADWTAGGVGGFVERAMNSYDPGATDRKKAVAALAAVLTDPWAKKYYTGYDVLHKALIDCGFDEFPRGTRPVAGGTATDFTVTGIIENRPVASAGRGGPTAFATLQDFCNRCEATDIQRIAEGAGDRAKSGPAFGRWVCLQTFLRDDLWVAGKVPGLKGDARATTAELIKRGVLMDPPSQYPPFPPNTNYWSIALTGAPTTGVGAISYAAADLFLPGPRHWVSESPDLIQFNAWFAYDEALNPADFPDGAAAGAPPASGFAPSLAATTATLLKNGEPVIGVPGATFADLRAQFANHSTQFAFPSAQPLA